MIATENVGQTPHVTGALDVVLAAQGIDPTAHDAQIAAQHRQVGQGFDIVRAGAVLGDPHAVDNIACPSLAVNSGCRLDFFGRNPRNALNKSRGVFLQGFLQTFKAFSTIFDERPVI